MNKFRRLKAREPLSVPAVLRKQDADATTLAPQRGRVGLLLGYGCQASFNRVRDVS